MKLTAQQKSAIKQTASEAKISYIRIFGSATKSLKKAKDIDVVISNPKKLTLSQYSILSSGLEKVFHKAIDIIELRSGLSPRLIIEIGNTSVPIFEDSKHGLKHYTNAIEPLLGVACDEILNYPKELRNKSLKLFEQQSRRKTKNVS